MLRKMDAERRHAWEMAEARGKGGVEDETIEGEPTSKEDIALDNVSVQSAGVPGRRVDLWSASQQLFKPGFSSGYSVQELVL
jgi:hypothetical protein